MKFIQPSIDPIILSISFIDIRWYSLAYIFGLIFGISSWLHSIQTGIVTTPGQVMIAALPLIFGLQFLLSFINFDISFLRIIKSW